MLDNITATLAASDPALIQAGACLLLATAAAFTALGLTVGWLARR